MPLSIFFASILGVTLNAGIVRAADNPDAEAILLAKASPHQKCQIEALKTLGWTFKTKSGHGIVDASGNPCKEASLSDAHAAGELNIQVPSEPTDQELKDFFATLSTTIYNSASECAFKMKVSRAVSTATTKLQGNSKYEFRDKQGGFCVLPDSDWRPLSGKTMCYVSKSTPSSAVECFYNKPCKSECEVGLEIGELATLYELYGKKDFDQAFQTNEMVVGSWDQLHKTRNPNYGASSQLKKSDEIELAKIGPQALSGVTGYMDSVDKSQLGSPSDIGENFVIVSVSEEAAQALSHGGFKKYNKINKEIWEHFNGIPDDIKSFVLGGVQAIGLTHKQRKDIEKMHALLNDPVYEGIKVYVHPRGQMSLKESLMLLLRLNSRTPYTFSLYPNNLNDQQFRRYVEFQVNKCEHPVTAPIKSAKGR